jgi:CHAD domain-containing protein
MASPFKRELSIVPPPPPPPQPTPREAGALDPEHLLEKKIEALRQAAQRVRRGEDGKAVHDARVATRRLQALLDVWKAELAPKPRRRARRALSRLRLRLGAARNREVSLEQIERVVTEAVGEDAAALDALVSRLRKQLPGDRAKVERAARKKNVESIVRDLRASVKRGSLEEWAGEKAMREAVARVERRRDDALTAIDRALADRRDQPLHRARIEAKKWRYAEEAVAEMMGVKSPKVVSELRGLQASLGENQDRAVLAALLERMAHRETKRENGARAQALRSRAAALHAERARHRTEWASRRDRLRAVLSVPSLRSD